jgi:dolichyl-phosphate beta-glucosyltransferase
MHLQRWAFDVEVLFLAEKLNVPVIEVPIEWHEIDGSKISLLWDSIHMAIDIVMMRINYVVGLWTIETKLE